MGAVLHFVGESSEMDGITVLSAQLQRRLTVMNHAARALREMGYRILKEEPLPEHGNCPLIRIQRGCQQSIAPLLDRAHSRQWHTEGGRKVGKADFMNVTVTWEER